MPRHIREYPKNIRYDDPSNSRMAQRDETKSANKRFHDSIARFRETIYGNEALLKDHPEVIEYLQTAMEIVEESRPTVGELYVRAKANAGANADLNKWRDAETHRRSSTIGELRAEQQKLEQKVGAYEIYIIERAIPRAINEAIQDDKLSHIPFVYYGWDSERLIATPATYELLEVDEVPGNLSIRGLLRYVNKTNRKNQNVRLEIIRRMGDGKHIRYLPAETASTGKEIYISGTPYRFSRKDPRLIGFGISFNEPKKMDYVTGTGLKGIHKAIEGATRSVRKRFKRLGLEA